MLEVDHDWLGDGLRLNRQLRLLLLSIRLSPCHVVVNVDRLELGSCLLEFLVFVEEIFQGKEEGEYLVLARARYQYLRVCL